MTSTWAEARRRGPLRVNALAASLTLLFAARITSPCSSCPRVRDGRDVRRRPTRWSGVAARTTPRSLTLAHDAAAQGDLTAFGSLEHVPAWIAVDDPDHRRLAAMARRRVLCEVPVMSHGRKVARGSDRSAVHTGLDEQGDGARVALRVAMQQHEAWSHKRSVGAARQPQ